MSKRGRNELEDTCKDNNIPSKRQKLCHETTSTKPTHSSIFSNEEDHKQFESIYNALQKSKPSQQMNIPCDIIKTLAEYSTGEIIQCENYTSCQNEILLLNKNNNPEFCYIEPNKSHYVIDVNKDTQIFCKDCKPNLFSCRWEFRDYDEDAEYYCSKHFIKNNSNIKCICDRTVDYLCDKHINCRFCEQPTCWAGGTYSRWFDIPAYCNSHSNYEFCDRCGKYGSKCEAQEYEDQIKYCLKCDNQCCCDSGYEINHLQIGETVCKHVMEHCGCERGGSVCEEWICKKCDMGKAEYFTCLKCDEEIGICVEGQIGMYGDPGYQNHVKRKCPKCEQCGKECGWIICSECDLDDENCFDEYFCQHCDKQCH